jgi:lysophospholipase
MENAKFYAEIADGPPQGAAYWMRTDDNVRVRIGTYGTNNGQHGTILLFLGRFGYVERYGRVAKDFDKHGFATIAIDWRSQGLSDRMANDPQTGHIHRFSDYQKDVAAMVKAAEELNLPKPWYLVGISMGACIGLRAMLEGLPVAASALISPMFGIKMSPFQRIAAWPLSWAAQRIGMGHMYVPGESGEIYMLKTPFEENNLTHNADMYEYWVEQARAVPELQIGGPSMGWLYQALSECRSLSKMRSPDIPCITFCGELDELVDNRAIQDRMERWPNGTLEMIKNAKHDVLTEVPEIGGEVMNQIVELFSNTKTVGST